MKVEPLEFVKVGEPTMEMTFSVNDSPFAGKEGKFVTSRHLRARLYRELLKDVSLRIADGDIKSFATIRLLSIIRFMVLTTGTMPMVKPRTMRF